MVVKTNSIFILDLHTGTWCHFLHKGIILLLNFFLFIVFVVQTLLFLSFLTVSITIIIVALMLSVARSSCDNSHPEDMELLTDDEDFSPRTTSKFNLTLPRKVSSFCLNFRQILEQENYFALNTWKVCVRNLPFIHASKKSFDIPRNKTKLIVFSAQMFSLFSKRERNVLLECWMLDAGDYDLLAMKTFVMVYCLFHGSRSVVSVSLARFRRMFGFIGLLHFWVLAGKTKRRK